MRLLEAIKSASEILEKSRMEDPLIDAELLALHAAGIDRLRAYMDNPEIDSKLISVINRLVKRRTAGEPLQYILGHVDFLGLQIKVGKGVLIPRPETELIAEEAIKAVRLKEFGVMGRERNLSRNTRQPSLLLLDLCTGSGCIALALAKEFPAARVYATDVSAKALQYAKGNADFNGTRNITFLKGPLFAPLQKGMRFELITANPPYIRTSDMPALQREVRDWEPVMALDGGEDGLDFYRQILSGAAGHLQDNGLIFLELGFGQAEAVAEIAGNSGFKNISLKKDFAGINRILKAGI